MLENDTDDHSLVKETLRDLEINARVKFFSSSTDMFHFLEEGHLPILLLIDYNSTPENGISVLQKIKSDARLNTLPVVILSESTLPEYRDEAYRLGASSFIQKPDSLQGTREKIDTFFRYWLTVAEV